MNNTAKVIKLARNGFIYASCVLTFLTIATGLLLTNSEIKYMGQMIIIAASVAVCLEIALLIVLKFFNAPKRGVTFIKS